MTPDEERDQQREPAAALISFDVIITTAKVPGRTPPPSGTASAAQDLSNIRQLTEVDVAPAQVARVSALLSDIGSAPPTIEASTGTITISVHNSVADLMASVLLLSGAKIVPLDIGLRRPSLDDVFLALTRHTGTPTTTPETPPPVRGTTADSDSSNTATPVTTLRAA